MWNEVLVAYGEVALKSKRVRKSFIAKLINNIKRGLTQAGITNAYVYQYDGRVFVKTDQVLSACEVLRRVFGTVYAAPCRHVKLNDLEGFIAKNAHLLIDNANSFAVRVRREGKHSFTSVELERKLGSLIVERTACKVNLSSPERTIFVEVRGDECYIYNHKVEGPGGLPLGTTASVVCLVSGGIDSPVAAWLLMKRGCIIVPLFARLSTGGDESDVKRFVEVVKVLMRWSVGVPMRVYMYEHSENLASFKKVAERYTCVLCKRMMYRVANALAQRVGALAIATGESLAQVASQTLHNLNTIDSASELPVLRPLIGMDKVEIEGIAKRIGTYEKSCMKTTAGCQPVDGCWAKPSKPVTKANRELVEKLESMVNVEDLLKASLNSLKEVTNLIT